MDEFVEDTEEDTKPWEFEGDIDATSERHNTQGTIETHVSLRGRETEKVNEHRSLM